MAYLIHRAMMLNDLVVTKYVLPNHYLTPHEFVSYELLCGLLLWCGLLFGGVSKQRGAQIRLAATHD